MERRVFPGERMILFVAFLNQCILYRVLILGTIYSMPMAKNQRRAKSPGVAFLEIPRNDKRECKENLMGKGKNATLCDIMEVPNPNHQTQRRGAFHEEL